MSTVPASTLPQDTVPVSGAEIVLKALAEQGVEVIFGYPGGAVLPIYDALFQQNALRHILVRAEAGAVHAAEGYARSTGKVGVVLVTSGPGATNAVTGLVDALMDSIPLVCLTGQVPTHLIGNDAFQEADTTGITRPATKHNYLVKDVKNLSKIVHEAFHVARSGRPGPVVIDLPKDVLMAKTTYTPAPEKAHPTYAPRTDPDPKAIAQAVDLMLGARRPILYTGGGIVNSGPHAAQALIELAHLTGFPVTSTLMGLGAMPAADPLFLGMLGMHGTYEANLTMHGCDVMVNLGARFDDRVTGRLNAFAPNSKKIHADIDPSSINKNVRVDVPVVGDAGKIVAAMIAEWKRRVAAGAQPHKKALADWWAQIEQWRKRDCLAYIHTPEIVKPQYALERLQALTAHRDDVFISTEVGQHQMWAAQFMKFQKPNRWMTSGGLGTMGYGLPAAMGVQIAPGRFVHRRCGRSLDPDEHPGTQHHRAVPPAGEDVHLEQPVYGHGAPVAGIAARLALFGKLHGRAARLRETGRSVRVRGPARQQGFRSRRRDQGDDRGQASGRGRHVRRPERKLLPDDPVGRRAQRNDPGAQRQAAGHGRRQKRRGGPGLGRRHGAGLAAGPVFDASPSSDFEQAPMPHNPAAIERHTIAVIVDNEPGVLARVIGLFSGRGYNIESLTVAETDADKHRSRITVVTTGTPMVIEQIKAQLDRLVPVHKVSDLTQEGAHVARELALVKVISKGNERVEALRIADIFRAKAIDSTIGSFVFEITGSGDKIDAFVNLMVPLGLAEVSRTGIVAIARGELHM